MPALAVAIVVLLINIFGSRAMDETLARVLCLMLVVVGTYIFVGNSGIVSFGQISFMAIGAYSTAILTMPPIVKSNFLPDLPTWLKLLQMCPSTAIVISVVVCAGIAFLIATPLMRLSGLAAGIATLSLLAVVFQTISNASGLTGGQQTLIGVPRAPSTLIILVVVVASFLTAAVFQQSSFGLMLRASRDEMNAAASLGVRMVRLRVYAFVLSAVVVGTGGAFYAQVLRSVSVSSFYIDMTATTMAMLVVGGMRSLAGAVTGVAVIAFLLEFVRQIEQGGVINDVTLPSGTTEVVVGLAMLIMLLKFPSGITGGREVTFSAFFRRDRG